MKILLDSKEIAQALNFGKYPVLIMNTDTKKGSKAVVIHKSRMHGDMRYNCTLEMDYEKENDGVLYISTNGSMIKGNYNYTDHLEDAEYSNAPIIEENQEIAIYMYSEKAKTGLVRIVKSEKIDSMCSVATILNDI